MGRHPIGTLFVAAMVSACAGSLRADDRSAPDRHGTKIDIDANAGVPGEPSVSAEAIDPTFGLSPNCERIGAFVEDFTGASRFRGNVVSIVGGDAIIQEIKMELQFFGATTLSFSIHERTPNTNTYTRTFVRTLENVEGTGSPTFFSSGPIVGGFALSEGKDYAIGVSWGPSVNVVYARNIQAQPTPFAGGQVLGLVGANNVTPPLNEQVNLFITTSGAYSMELCIKPSKGACCQRFQDQLGSDVFECREVLEAECVQEGAFFHGQRTTCADSPCRFGACCSPCVGADQCKDNYTLQACDAIDGFHHTRRTCAQMGDQCEAVTGACCLGGVCAELCEADCLAQLGVYRGDNTKCDPVFNPCRGACCIQDVGCINRSEQACLEFNLGRYRGDGTTCATLAPELQCLGACCFQQAGVDVCVDGANASTRAACAVGQDVDSAIYIGDALSCPMTQANPPTLACPLLDGDADENNACCLPNGACTNTNQSECRKLAGEWNAALNCEDVGQACAVGACCFDDGTCTVLTETGCEGTVVDHEFVGFGGHWAGVDTTCSVLTCDNAGIPTGACCDADGTCVERREARCDALDGLYEGNGTACAPNVCTPFGACCREDGVCFDQKTATQCDALGGSYKGDTSSCASEVCDLRGACCTSTGRCLQLNQLDCAGLTDANFFPGGDCSRLTCGACCRADATCEVVVEDKCSGSADFTADTACADLDPACSVLSVCCTGEFLCMELREGECAAAGGYVQGPVVSNGPNAFVCAPEVCRTGSCCVAGACADTDAFSFQGSCEALAPDVVFVPGARCALDAPCAATGACCVEGVCQENVSTTNCVALGGTFQGVDSVCGTDSCGACCNNGVCRDALSSSCADVNDTFFAGTTCANDDPCAPNGACCVSGACQTARTAAQCAAAGGIYLGDDTTCAGGECLLGACCRPNGVCTNGEIASGCAGADETFSRGFSCNQVACPPRGACCESGTCSLKTASACTGDYAGDLTACSDGACVPTACCSNVANQGVCEMVSPVACLARDGFSLSGSGCSTPGLRCDLGSCCAIDGTCVDNVFQAACAAPRQFSLATCANRTCEKRGACCVPGDGVCQVVSRTECTVDLGGFYAGDEVDCVDDFCAIGACCLNDGGCIPDTRQACELFGHYTTAGLSCTVAPCCRFAVVSTDPMNCAVDAGMPGDRGGTVARPPLSSVVIEYGCPLQQVPSFTVRVEPNGMPPTVEQVDLSGTTVTVTLGDPVAPGTWTCLSQFGTGAEWCFGALPADVNADLVADSGDLMRLVDSLNGIGAALPVHRCDADRTNKCAPPDVIKVIDLLNGGWSGKTLPACPTAP